MFRSLPPADFDDDALMNLAAPGNMTSDKETDGAGNPKVTPETDSPPDDEENFGIPSGYTYFGQFVDHDITFDPVTGSVKLDDPDGLINFRTPALDLDSLYGRGPSDVPFMYDSTGRKFLLGDRSLTGARASDPATLVDFVPDLPRFHGRAIIGDKRNDENVIVSQLHGLFQRFHNFLADTLTDDTGQPLPFVEVQRLVRWHYQWLVLFDYLPRLVGRHRVEAILPHIADNSNIYNKPPKLYFFTYRNDPFMPVEFSGAAYRFGHSMVRPIYRLSAFDFTPTTPVTGLGGRKVVFAANADEGLNGFQEFDVRNGIDWHLFFETRTHKLGSPATGTGRVQPAYKIDTSLVNPLAFLPEFSIPGTDNPIGAPSTNNLAFRNLKRGVSLLLPSGQAVAWLMGLEPIPDERLLVGKANADGIAPDLTNKSGVANKSIIDIDPRFAGKAPLWFYILAEGLDGWRQRAEAVTTDDDKNAQPTHLGPVGGRIVAEVLIGLILGDSDSFLNMEPNWKPMFGNLAGAPFFDRFTMGDLIELVPNQ